MNKRVRPFDLVKEMMNVCGVDISYFYDDLIFSDHSMFIIQFVDKSPELLKLYINRDMDHGKQVDMKDYLFREAEKRGFIMMDEGRYYLTDNPETQEVSIHYV